MVAFHSHPSALVGGQRPTKFLKHLSKDHENTIDFVTVKDKYYEFLNQGSSGVNMTNVRIHRTNLTRRFLPIRDEGLVWFFPLLFKMLTLCLRNNYDVIYITGNPFLQFILLPFFKFFFRIPYVLDFRDPWVLSPYRTPRNSFYGYIIKRIEYFVVKNASAVINVTLQANNLFKRNYSKLPDERFHIIENGFDYEDFLNIENIDLKLKYGDALYICYAGKFSNFRSPEQFVKAIALYNSSRKYKKINFIHIGKEEPPLKKLFNDFDEQESYICTGYVPYKKCLSFISSSDFALLVSGGHPYEPTTKIFDYIALEKKILGISPSKEAGFLSDIFSQYGNSIMSEDNYNLIFDAFRELDKLSKTSSHNLRSRFSRETQATELDLVLKKSISNYKKYE